jgi:iron complex outermembrane recepter protein
MKQLIYILSLILSLPLAAQNIKGTVIENNEKNDAVSFANVLLYKAGDSTLYKFSYTEDNGTFQFNQVQEGTYFVKITFVGLSDYTGKTFAFDGQNTLDLGKIQLESDAVKIAEVTITAQKPMLEVKPDKLVLNVAGSILASGDDALSLLRKAPGVLVDNNENISLLGKSGLVIYIDGKPSPLRPADLANMLKNMSANDIESIEIISNPSARYDAQGTAGIINIKRKKVSVAGFNGTLNTTLRQGLTRAGNAGMNVNYKSEKLNVFANASYFNNENQNHNNFYRTQNELGFRTLAENRNNVKGLNSKITADYSLSSKSTIGMIAEFNTDRFNMKTWSTTSMGNMGLNQIDSLLVNNGDVKASTDNMNLNANYYYDGGNETTFNVDVNFGRFSRENNLYTPNRYTTPNREQVTSSFEVRNITPATIDITTVKADYERKLGKGKFGAGIKSALVSTDNTLKFYNITDVGEELNESRSNRFLYDEWVNAIYATYNIQWKKIGLNTGLRVENSNTKGELIAMQNGNDKVVERQYTDIFPSAGVSYMASPNHNFQLSVGRRINRPNYQDLNPFEFQLDQLTFEKGNAFLNPEYTSNIQLVHTFMQRFNTTLNYSHTDNVIARLVDTSGLKGSFITWDNIAYRKTLSIGISAPISITDKWSTFTNLNGVHTRNRADFGGGKIIHLNVSSFNMYHQQTIKLGKGWSMEVSGWYTSPSIWEGAFVMNSMWAMGAGVSKKFNDDRTKLTINVDDIFKTNVWSGESTFGGLYMDVSGGWDSRRVRVNVSYNFGKNNNNGKSRRRSTGLEEEQQRIKKSS